MQKIVGIALDSIAQDLGVCVGDKLVSINGQPVLDVVDYEFLCAEERLTLCFLRANDESYEIDIEKEAWEPLGLRFETGLMSPVRSCHNHCQFCFIDQMPKVGRKTLQFKDDDWRMSFIMGNYISLTNVDEAEFQRIIDRRVSPLFISVHATDPSVRISLMRNRSAGELMPRLKRLKDAGLRFHCQIVCCPGLNDGEVLQQTMEELYSLHPAAVSLAVVPVGLTKFREGLAPLRTFTLAEAKSTLAQINAFAAKCKTNMGSFFVFASDELVLSAKEPLPQYESYEDFPQIENGVGLLRLFEDEFLNALSEQPPLKFMHMADVVGGTLANSFFVELYKKLLPYNITLIAHPIQNDYFGHSITVGGLVTGQDIVSQANGRLKSNVLFLPHNMLREKEDVFLDGMTVDELSKALGVKVIPVRGEGEVWIETLFTHFQD
ncbi:DUF512 domain-containing protein [Eubacteriales bacterium OttesenSCG-928-K08]|nr:DUF512 domain-containing protein [Eubacteriales bacterium OttesenSCG-928-K08]